MGIETRTSGSSGQCLTNWARQESVGQEISEVSFVCFMHHFTCWTLFISRINRSWLYKGHEDSGWQLNVNLAQLVRHWPEDLEVLVSNPTGSIFWRNFFALSCVKICQIIWQKRLSWKTHLFITPIHICRLRTQAAWMGGSCCIYFIDLSYCSNLWICLETSAVFSQSWWARKLIYVSKWIDQVTWWSNNL